MAARCHRLQDGGSRARHSHAAHRRSATCAAANAGSVSLSLIRLSARSSKAHAHDHAAARSAQLAALVSWRRFFVVEKSALTAPGTKRKPFRTAFRGYPIAEKRAASGQFGAEIQLTVECRVALKLRASAPLLTITRTAPSMKRRGLHDVHPVGQPAYRPAQRLVSERGQNSCQIVAHGQRFNATCARRRSRS